jgi:cysteine desulfurase/selenocysteine lyase
MVDWKKVREDFPVTRERVYFISAGMSPVPTPVLTRIIEEYSKLNTAGDIHWERDIASYKALCSRLAWHMGAEPGDLAVVMNTSTAMSIVAMSLKQEGGDFNVVSVQDEFPSTTVPFEYQGIRMKYVEPEGARYPVNRVLDVVDDGTRAVLTSYVQYSTGFRQDLAALGGELKKRGVLLIVNATQAFPIFPVDVKAMGIGALSASLHKWGFIGHAGAVFHTSPEFRKRFPAPMAGWLSVNTEGKDFIHTGKNKPFRLYDSADRYVMGSINYQAINPMGAVMDYLETIGFENIRARIFELTDRLIEGLRSGGMEIVSPIDRRDERSAILSFSPGDDTRGCLRHLADRNIHASYRGGNIRVSVNFFNDEGEIDALIAAVDEFRKGRR